MHKKGLQTHEEARSDPYPISNDARPIFLSDPVRPVHPIWRGKRASEEVSTLDCLAALVGVAREPSSWTFLQKNPVAKKSPAGIVPKSKMTPSIFRSCTSRVVSSIIESLSWRTARYKEAWKDALRQRETGQIKETKGVCACDGEPGRSEKNSLLVLGP
jgi:hypothetical protein